MALAYVGIGSNIDPEANIRAALKMLSERMKITALSTFYKTPPLGSSSSHYFINGVAEVETGLPPRELKFNLLRKIEERLGRIRKSDKYADRTIDLDILLYGDLVLHEPDLTIPDPDITTRAFIAAPLVELDPNLILPGSETRLSDVVELLHADEMVPLGELTRALRNELEIMDEY